MLTIKAWVHEGRLKLDQAYDAPEGTEIDLAVLDDGDALDSQERGRLHEALVRGHEQMLRGDVVPANDVLATLRAQRE